MRRVARSCRSSIVVLAVAALIEPSVIPDAPLLPLAVECAEGPAWGATVLDFRAPFFAGLDGSAQETPVGFANWRIGLHADAERYRRMARAMWGD